MSPPGPPDFHAASGLTLNLLFDFRHALAERVDHLEGVGSFARVGANAPPAVESNSSQIAAIASTIAVSSGEDRRPERPR